MQRLLLIIFYITIGFCSIDAQNISVKVPREVATGENFRLAFVFNSQEVENFRVGSFPDGLEVLAGPYTSRQSSYSIINGHTSSSSSTTYTYTVYAAKAGTYTIPAAHAKVDGKETSSHSVKITVSGSAPKQNSSPRMHSNSEPDEMRSAGSKISSSDLFIRVTANKHKMYEQEPLMLTYKVYTLVDLNQLQGKMPDLKGFHTQEIQLPQQKSFHVENVNGRNYRCVTWSQYVLFPQMTGKMTIPAITFKGTVIQQNRAVDPFEAFFNGGSGYVEVKKDIIAPAVNVEVMPLPQKPTGFSGGVGQFKIAASVDKKEVKAGEPITLHVTISGVGNLKLLKRPEPQFPSDFDKYDPKQTDKTRLTANGLEGSVTYDFLVVPRNQGTYTIPAINFIYFDTKTSSYKTVSTDAIQLKVDKGDGKSGSVESYSRQADNDIHDLKHGGNELSNGNTTFYGSTIYYCLLLVIFGSFVVLLIVFRKRAIDNADIVKKRGRRANKVATKRLRRAAQLMQANKSDAFYDEVLRTLWGYVGDKLNMPVEQLSRDNISNKLASSDVDDNTIKSFIAALDECEFCRYAPGDEVGNMNKTYSSASEAIMNIEDSLKKKRHRGKSALVILMLLFATTAGASTNKTVADEAYLNGNYQLAISQYEQLASKGESFELFYNLGNAYYRSQNLAKSMLWYERARLLKPSDSDVRFNLQFVNARTMDKIPLRTETIFTTWYHSLAALFTSDEWAVMTIVTISLTLILFLVYLFSNSIVARKLGFFGSMCFFAVFLLSILLGWQQSRIHTSPRRAIIMNKAVDVRKTPTATSQPAFTIHEATRVTVTDSLKTWREIRLDDDREGWVDAKCMEEI